MTQWNRYIMCRICRAPAGIPCFTRSGRISGGVTDGVATTLPEPHKTRQLSKRKGVRDGEA